MENLHPTKKLIFDAITDLLNEQGISGVTFSNISARTYLQRASIAYHFSGRQDMLNQYYSYFLEVNGASPVPVSLQAPPGDDPVESFCRLIDGLFGNSRENPGNANAADALAAHMLISSLADPEAKRLIRRSNEEADEVFLRVLRPYIDIGIIDEARIPLAMADMAVYSATESFIDIFDFDISNYDLALKATIERVKRTFLRDGLYPSSGDISRVK